MSTALTSLPNEIIHYIARLTGNDVQNFRAVSKVVEASIAPVMWEMTPVILHLNREHLGLSMSMLEEFSHAPVDKFWRLEIKSLDPSKEHNPPERVWRSNDEGVLVPVPPEPEDTDDIIAARAKLPKILPKALSALKGLRSVKWSVARKDPDFTPQPVLESLRLLPHLTDVQIITEVDATLLPLHCLTNGSLQSLAIEQKSDPPSDYNKFISSLVIVLTHNPHLAHLKLEMTAYGSEALPFQDLFQNIPLDTVQLRSLTLCGWSIQVTPKVQSHLQTIQSIELPWYGDVDTSPLWKSLADSSFSIPLSRISCNQVSSELLDLLEAQSIQGLKALAFEYAGAETDEESDRLAQRFYNDVLHRHQDSLRELSIIPSFTGDWPVGMHNLDMFNECKHLTKLSVGLDPEQIVPGEKNDIVASFIARVARLPDLSTIALHPVSSKSHRFARCGTGRFMAKLRILARMQEAIEKTQITMASRLPCHPLRILLKRYNQTTMEFVSEAVHDENGEYGNGASIRFRRCDEQNTG
ncbi:hypothetical protein PQX77_008342 [Marasmius sp. AFHP31]|nr:hypothetical protein PQX77_008342 [Marasmius sp. AFHP31]